MSAAWFSVTGLEKICGLLAQTENINWKVMACGLNTSRKRFLPFVLVPGTTLRHERPGGAEAQLISAQAEIWHEPFGDRAAGGSLP
jgi:hypothetical protein